MDGGMEVDPNEGEIVRVLCCLCGVSIEPNPSNMCYNCIQSEVSITDEILTQATIQSCRSCERWLNPPKFWLAAPLESKELLELCLKRVKGLSKVKLIDASFLWTEPHSKRLKVKLVVQQDLFADTAVQQTTVVEFTITNQMCDACQKEMTGQDVWTAVVQVRQKTDHKRTFLALEQSIVKAGLHQECTKVGDQPDGVDFFYSHRSHAQRMVDFLGTMTPTKWKHSQELVSHDSKSNTADFHHSYVVDIAPICKGDLVALPVKLFQALGGLGPVCVCVKVNQNIVLLDPNTLKTTLLSATIYWKSQFDAWGTTRQLVNFFVMDIQVDYSVPANGKYVLAEVQVQKADEVGSGQEYYTRTHLGHVLKEGDICQGYLIAETNMNDAHISEHRKARIPDVVLVNKAKNQNV